MIIPFWKPDILQNCRQMTFYSSELNNQGFFVSLWDQFLLFDHFSLELVLAFFFKLPFVAILHQTWFLNVQIQELGTACGLLKNFCVFGVLSSLFLEVLPAQAGSTFSSSLDSAIWLSRCLRIPPTTQASEFRISQIILLRMRVQKLSGKWRVQSAGAIC